MKSDDKESERVMEVVYSEKDQITINYLQESLKNYDECFIASYRKLSIPDNLIQMHLYEDKARKLLSDSIMNIYLHIPRVYLIESESV